MRNRIMAVLSAIAVALGLSLSGGAPATASVPDWDKAVTWEQAGYSAEVAADLEAKGFTVKTPAEWNAIRTIGVLPAQAKRTPVDCPNTDKMCLWNGYGWTGTMWALPSQWLQDGVGSVNGLSFYGSGINNASKSWYNRTHLPARLYDNYDCANYGWYRDLGYGNVAVSYDASTNDWEDRISSVSTTYDAGNYCTNVPGQ